MRHIRFLDCKAVNPIFSAGIEATSVAAATEIAPVTGGERWQIPTAPSFRITLKQLPVPLYLCTPGSMSELCRLVLSTVAPREC